jgi:uncharacterized protein (DUF885 family)
MIAKPVLIRITLLILAALTALVVVVPRDAWCSGTSADGAAKKFRELSDQFMKESLARSPSNASQAGYHTHIDAKTGKAVDLDAVLDDMSIEFKKEQRQFDERWRARFHNETPLSALDAQDAADWHLIDDQISLDLLDLDKIQNYKHNPTVVVELIGTAIFQPLTETYATREVRARDVLSRIRQVPRLLDQVKEYLADCDPIFIKTAVEENAGNIDLIENTVGKEISALPTLKGEYDDVAPPAVAALKSFSQWLQDDLGKRPCSGGWRLGKELYDQKFRLVMETDGTPEQLLAGAERDLKAVRAEMLQLALPLHKQMYPDHSEHTDLSDHERENLIIGEVLNKISENHPSREDLQKAVEADLDGIKKFIRDNKIVSLSARENLKVIPTPSFMRGIYSVAGFHSAPPLEPQAEAEYWVTPIDPKTSDDKAESKLREYNNYTLKWLTIHEALPGHYVQFEHLNNIEPKERRLLRSLYANGAYVEGWAEYIAQVMMDEGYMKDDPRFRMIMRKIRLRLLANTILDVRLQTMGMTDEQAIDLMTKETFQTQAEADGKLVRAKLSSTQLPTYYAGLTEWLAFRKRYQTEKGKQFDLLQFHDRALDQGPLPVPIVEKLLL